MSSRRLRRLVMAIMEYRISLGGVRKGSHLRATPTDVSMTSAEAFNIRNINYWPIGGQRCDCFQLVAVQWMTFPWALHKFLQVDSTFCDNMTRFNGDITASASAASVSCLRSMLERVSEIYEWMHGATRVTRRYMSTPQRYCTETIRLNSIGYQYM